MALRPHPGIADGVAQGSLARAEGQGEGRLPAIKDLNWSDQGKLNGFKDTNDQAYDVVRETAKLANIDLKKQK